MPLNLNTRMQLPRAAFPDAAQPQTPAATSPSRYLGANTDRQRRFDSRSERRWGNWGILGVPTAFLWTDPFAPLMCDPFDEACEPTVAVVDLWG